MSVIYKDRVFVGNLTTDVTEDQIYSFLKDLGYSPVDVKLMRDRQGVSKGFGFVDMSNDEAGEMQARDLITKNLFRLRKGQTIVFKRAFRKRYVSESSSRGLTVEVASCGDWFDSDAEMDGTDSSSSGGPEMCCQCGGINPPQIPAVFVPSGPATFPPGAGFPSSWNPANTAYFSYVPNGPTYSDSSHPAFPQYPVSYPASHPAFYMPASDFVMVPLMP